MKIFIQFFLVLCLFIFINKGIQVQAATFKDVPSNHYAKEAIEWASENGIVSGIRNNLFAPSDAFTYEQFAKLVTDHFKLEANEQYYLSRWGDSNFFTSSEPYDTWSAPYFNALATYQVPLKYTDEQAFRTEPVNRGLLAQVFGYLLNNDADLENSISF